MDNEILIEQKRNAKRMVQITVNQMLHDGYHHDLQVQAIFSVSVVCAERTARNRTNIICYCFLFPRRP